MSGQTVSQWLNSVGVELLPGVAAGSTVLCVGCFLVMWLVRRRSASVQSCVWQATASAIVLSAVVLGRCPWRPDAHESCDVRSRSDKEQ